MKEEEYLEETCATPYSAGMLSDSHLETREEQMPTIQLDTDDLLEAVWKQSLYKRRLMSYAGQG